MIEKELVGTLGNYLEVARNHLGLIPPLRLAVGMVGIDNYRLAVPQHIFADSFAGDIYENSIKYETQIEFYDIDCRESLKPFFNKMYDVAGIQPPE